MLGRHLDSFKKDEFDYIIYDEVHHVVAEIGDYAFTHSGIIPKTISNAKKVSASYLYSSGNKAIITPLQGITSVVISNTVMSIGKCAFTDNKLTEITIPSSVTNIGDYPNNVTSESCLV